MEVAPHDPISWHDQGSDVVLVLCAQPLYTGQVSKRGAYVACTYTAIGNSLQWIPGYWYDNMLRREDS